MASYYDKDELLKFIKTDLATYYPSTYLNGILVVARDIEKKMSTEDVVPRSEVEKLQETCDLFSETIKEMDKEIERLKVSDASKEECTIRQHCEIKELKAELNKAKQEVAKQIFDKVKKRIHNEYNDLSNIVPTDDDYYLGKLAGISEAEIIIAELEKKYKGKDTDVPTNKGDKQ